MALRRVPSSVPLLPSGGRSAPRAPRPTLHPPRPCRAMKLAAASVLLLAALASVDAARMLKQGKTCTVFAQPK